MKTADEMNEFCLHNYGQKVIRNSLLFEQIVDILPADEDVKMCFTGYIDLESITDTQEKLYGFAVTNQRIIMAQRKKAFDPKDYKLSRILFKQTQEANIKTISLDMINDISTTVSKISIKNFGFKSTLGYITIDTIKEVVTIGVDRNQVKKITQDMNDVLIKAKTNKNNSPVVVQKSDSVADELMKYKQLLDMGVLTQEEFDKKKNQLLNL